MKKSAFTLAEVLITLTIIGVIAALTIPNLMQKWQDHADVAKVKQAYSIIRNAYKMASAENGELSEWNLPEAIDTSSADNRLYVAQIMAKYLKTSNFCGISRGNGACDYYAFNSSGTGTGQFMLGLSGAGNTEIRLDQHTSRIQLANGMLLGFSYPVLSSSDNNAYFTCFVDINGTKKPNRLGYDVFLFMLQEKNNKWISPFDNKPEYCNRFASAFRDGPSCAYWVIKHGNMDYKYRDISAEW